MTPAPSRRRGAPLADVASLSPAAQVKAVLAASGTGTSKPPKRGPRFLLDQVSPREAIIAPVLGVYLGLAVVRLHERFPVLQVPYLLWVMMAIMLSTVLSALPRGAWSTAWKLSPQLRLVAVLATLAVLTVPLGIWMSGALDYLINRYTVAIAVYVSCFFLFRDRKVLRRVLMIYVLIATVVASVNVVSYFNKDVSLTAMSPEEQAIYRETGVLNNETNRQTFGSLDPNDLAAVMATTLPLALWLATGSFRRRITWTPCALIMAIAVIPTASRGGMLGLAAAAVVLILVGTEGAKRFLLASTVGLGAFLFNALAGSQMDRMSNLGGTDYNYTASEGRIAIWKRGIVWMIKRPWGYGLDNFPVYFGWLNGPDRAAHNSLIQYGVELGVLGIAAYLTICWTLVKSLLLIRRNAMHGGKAEKEMATLCGHVLATLAACWTTGFFLSNAYYPMTYMAIGIGSAVVFSRVEAKSAAPATAAAEPAKTAGLRRRHLKAFQPA